ncbi:hypothetical protein GCM10028801_42050 [Nocardioides maradonensis]
MRAANLGLKLLLELGALALLGGWGFLTGDGWVALALGIGAPAVMVLVWGRLCAPRAAGRLPARSRVPLELTILTIAGVLGFAAGLHVAAVVFLVAVVVNAVGLSVNRQWEA